MLRVCAVMSVVLHHLAYLSIAVTSSSSERFFSSHVTPLLMCSRFISQCSASLAGSGIVGLFSALTSKACGSNKYQYYRSNLLWSSVGSLVVALGQCKPGRPARILQRQPAEDVSRHPRAVRAVNELPGYLLTNLEAVLQQSSNQGDVLLCWRRLKHPH